MSCHDDIGEVNPGTEQTNQVTVPLEFGEIDGDLVGYIFDDSNNPISGASVSIYSGETITNEFGVFSFVDVNLDPQGTFIRVEKSGFLVGTDLVYPNTNGKGTSRIIMLKVKNNDSFEASEGGVVEIEGGGTVTFSPSSLIRANGSIYDGQVKSTAYRLSPIDPDLGSKMAGGLLGIDKEGRHRVLSTYGIVAIELRGFDNQKLRIKSDKMAELSLPVDNEIQSLVEDDVPSWNFDLSDGIWRENLAASYQNGAFKTQIKALGFWNIATQNGVSQVCGKLVYNNGLPAKNYIIQVTNNGLPSRIGITDLDGFFCGKMPLGENLLLQVLHPICGKVLESRNIGPFEDVGTIGDIILDVEENYVSGIIECSGEMTNQATIVTISDEATNIFYPNANGSFSINLEEIICNQPSTFTIFAYDTSTEMKSEEQELPSSAIASLKLEVCEKDCGLDAMFVFEKDDYCLSGDYNRVTLDLTGGSGDYSFLWGDGTTDQFNDNLVSGGEICVDIIDESTGCEYSLCEDVVSYDRLNIVDLKSSNTECEFTSGFIELDVIGGKQPLSFEWTGPDGYSSSQAQIADLTPGVYTIDIKDDAGCSITESVEVFIVTAEIEGTFEDFCDLTVLTAVDVDGYKPYTYSWSAGEPLGDQLFIYTPGSYGLTITDAHGCVRSGSWVVSNVGSLPVLDPSYSCEAGIVSFSNLDDEFEYFYQASGEDEVIVELVDGDLDVSILEVNYRFDVGAKSPTFANCTVSEQIDLPSFEGLEISNVNFVSCESCEDGSIDFVINVDAECDRCNPGEALVLRRSDGEDVTALNEDKILGKGEYYVIVLDNDNGCYIAHSLVVVE